MIEWFIVTVWVFRLLAIADAAVLIILATWWLTRRIALNRDQHRA